MHFIPKSDRKFMVGNFLNSWCLQNANTCHQQRHGPFVGRGAQRDGEDEEEQSGNEQKDAGRDGQIPEVLVTGSTLERIQSFPRVQARRDAAGVNVWTHLTSSLILGKI